LEAIVVRFSAGPVTSKMASKFSPDAIPCEWSKTEALRDLMRCGTELAASRLKAISVGDSLVQELEYRTRCILYRGKGVCLFPACVRSPAW